MRLTFSNPNHMNTTISDEQGNVLYKIYTPSTWMLSKRVTTIKKYHWGGARVAGTIEWPRLFGQGLFRFSGRMIPVDEMFKRRMFKSGLYFAGPDQRTYKWKISPHCWMKCHGSNVELVRYHKKNLGILKPAHPAYLDVSPEVVPMLNLIIVTFVYAE